MNAIRTLLVAIVVSLALPVAPALAENARGRQLFTLCAQCHGADGGGNRDALAPDIAGLPQWFVEGQLDKFRVGGRGTHFDDIGGMRMRPMSMWIPSEEDVEAVSAYVASLPVVAPEPQLEGGDPQRGKALYTPCVACHGPEGAGNQELNAPPINHASDWYLLTSLKNFKQGVRGTNPKDTTGMLMRPMSMTLADEQAMKDVIAYIMSLPTPVDEGAEASAPSGPAGGGAGQ